MADEATTTLCPRCARRRFTPYDTQGVGREQIEQHPFPALSRVAQVYICSPCGQDEAMRDFQGEPPIPPDEWPIYLGGEFGQGQASMDTPR